MLLNLRVLPGHVQEVEDGDRGGSLLKHHDVIGVRHQFQSARLSALAAGEIGVGQAVHLLVYEVFQLYSRRKIVLRYENHDGIHVKQEALGFLDSQLHQLCRARHLHRLNPGAQRGPALLHLFAAQHPVRAVL